LQKLIQVPKLISSPERSWNQDSECVLDWKLP